MKDSRRRVWRPLTAIFWILNATVSASAASAGFQVTGLQNLVVRMGEPPGPNAYVWMGDRLGNSPRADLIRVDDAGQLVMQWAGPFPRGVLYEFSEYSLISVSDTDIHIHFGRVRIVSGLGMEIPSLSTAFGTFRLSENMIVDAEVTGQRILFFCLAGDAAYVPQTQKDTAASIQIPADHMVIIGAAGGREAGRDVKPRPTPPEIQEKLGSRQHLQMRYRTDGLRPPRLLWFSPQAGKIVDRQSVTVMGRVDVGPGSAQVTVNQKQAEVQNSGLFSAKIELLHPQDTIVVHVKHDGGAGTFVLRAGSDVNPPDIFLDPVSETTSLRQVLLSGALSEPGVILLSGKSPQSTRGRQFQQMVDLNPGTNSIRLLAFDRAGHRAEKTVDIFRISASASGVGRLAAEVAGDPENIFTDTAALPSPKIISSGWKDWGFVIEIESFPPPRALYRIHRSFSKDGPFMAVGQTDQNAFTDLGPFEPGAGFYYRVSMADELGSESPMSEAVSFIPGRAKPAPPINLTAKIEGKKLRIFWSRENPGAVGGYNVYRVLPSSPDPVRIASVPAPPYMMDLPDTFPEMTFCVSAVSAYSPEESERSEKVLVKR